MYFGNIEIECISLKESRFCQRRVLKFRSDSPPKSDRRSIMDRLNSVRNEKGVYTNESSFENGLSSFSGHHTNTSDQSKFNFVDARNRLLSIPKKDLDNFDKLKHSGEQLMDISKSKGPLKR